MIIPSIDIQHGKTVQLIGGKELAIEAGDPMPIAETFSRVGELAIIDLDAARGETSQNRSKILDVVRKYPARVGGGIRSVDAALDWLDAGASRVILGTAARPEVLGQLPKERVIAALDAQHDEVVVQGWTQGTGMSLKSAISEIRHLVGGFLITRVEKEGRMGGIDIEDACRLRDACGDARLTLAGGVATAQEVALLDKEGIDAQVGMAIYRGVFSCADALSEILVSDRPDGLWPTVVCDAHGVALGLAYSSRRSLEASLRTGEVHYESRKRGLWRKGASSGATQRLLRASLDCDRDTLRFVVLQNQPGFCHEKRWTCFDGEDFGVACLDRTIAERRRGLVPGSYTSRLFQDQTLLNSKVLEEAHELVDAQSREELVHEMADLLYFTLVKGASKDVRLIDLESELARRARRIRRRGGDAKPSVEVGQ